MQQGWRKKLTVATLLLAALAAHVDIPRLNLALNLGDTLNAVRVMDPVQHIRMELRLDRLLQSGQGEQLRTDLQDGQDSLALLGDTSLLNAVIPPLFQAQAPLTRADDHRFASGEYRPLTGLAAAFLALDLPPPKTETAWQPPRLQCPVGFNFSQAARAPPIALR